MDGCGSQCSKPSKTGKSLTSGLHLHYCIFNMYSIIHLLQSTIFSITQQQAVCQTSSLLLKGNLGKSKHNVTERAMMLMCCLPIVTVASAIMTLMCNQATHNVIKKFCESTLKMYLWCVLMHIGAPSDTAVSFWSTYAYLKCAVGLLHWIQMSTLDKGWVHLTQKLMFASCKVSVVKSQLPWSEKGEKLEGRTRPFFIANYNIKYMI